MATRAGGAYIEIRADNSNLQGDLNRSHGQVTASANSMQGQVSKAFKVMAVAAVASIAAITYKLAALSKESAMLSARFETLDIVMKQVGKNAGYSAAQMDYFDISLRKTGISMIESRNSLTKMAQANLDLSKATILGRIAQDAAVIGNINSSEAFGRMIVGIQRGQPLILRTLGINVDFQASYKKVAEATDRATTSFSQSEKATIRQNAVIEYGARIAGTYEAAMTTAGKKILSFTRYVEDFKVKMGVAFGPSMVTMVDAATAAMKQLQIEISKPETQEALANISTELAKIVVYLSSDIPGRFKAINDSIDGMINLYKSLPDGVIGAAGVGIVGKIVFGGPAGKLLLALGMVDSAMGILGNSLGDLKDKHYATGNAMINLWNSITDGLGITEGAINNTGTAIGGILPVVTGLGDALKGAGFDDFSTGAKEAADETENTTNKMREQAEASALLSAAIKAQIEIDKELQSELIRNSEETYTYQLELLNAKYEEMSKKTTDTLLLDQWYNQQVKLLESSRYNDLFALQQKRMDAEEEYASKVISVDARIQEELDKTALETFDYKMKLLESDFAEREKYASDEIALERLKLQKIKELNDELSRSLAIERGSVGGVSSSSAPSGVGQPSSRGFMEGVGVSPGTRYSVYQGQTWTDENALRSYIQSQKDADKQMAGELQSIADNTAKANQLAQESAQRELEAAQREAQRILEQRKQEVGGQRDRLVDWILNKQREDWGIPEWEKQFGAVEQYAISLDPTESGFYENGLVALENMVDILMEIDSLQERQLNEQKKLADTLLGSIKTIDETIIELKGGDLSPVTSKEFFTETFAEKLTAAIESPESVGEFTSFVSQTFLPFMKTYYSDSEGYMTVFNNVLSSLDMLKGMYGTEWIDAVGGTKISYNWDDMVSLPDPAEPGFTTIYTKDSIYSLPDENAPDFIKTFLKDDLYALPSETDTGFTEVYYKDDMFVLPDAGVSGFIETYTKDELYTLPDPVAKEYNWIDMVSFADPEKIDWSNLIDYDFQGLSDMMDAAFDTSSTTAKLTDIYKGLHEYDVDKDIKDIAKTFEGIEGIYKKVPVTMEKEQSWMDKLFGRSKTYTEMQNQLIWKPGQEDTSALQNALDRGMSIWIDSATKQTIDLGETVAPPIDAATSALESFIDILGLVPSAADLIINKMKAGSTFQDAFVSTVGYLDSLEDPLGGVGDAAGDTDDKTSDLVKELTSSLVSYDAVSLSLGGMSTNVESQIGIAADFFNKLADGLGFTFDAAKGASLVTAISTLTPAPLAATAISTTETSPYWAEQIYDYMGRKDHIVEHSAHGEIIMSDGTTRFYANGGLTDGLSYAGEIGPEWVVPTYEPQRSNFLRDVGADPDAIGKSISKYLGNSGSGGKDVTVNIIVDGQIINTVVKKGLSGEDTDLIEMVRSA